MRPLFPLVLSASLTALAACGPTYDPSVGVHVTPDGRVLPSAGASVGGVSLAATPGGGAIGTRFGPIRLSAGF